MLVKIAGNIIRENVGQACRWAVYVKMLIKPAGSIPCEYVKPAGSIPGENVGLWAQKTPSNFTSGPRWKMAELVVWNGSHVWMVLSVDV